MWVNTLLINYGVKRALCGALILLVGLTSTLNAESLSFAETTIGLNALGAASVYVADIDSDGDADILSASEDDDTIAWYVNQGETFTTNIITAAADSVRSVYAVDLDGDGDVDVLSASFNDDKVAWYENTGSGFTTNVITTNADGARSVYAADLDGDGDLDVISASINDDKVAWYENDGASDPAFTERVITVEANGANWIYVADLDRDGDMDVISSSFGDSKIAWYRNDGASMPSFSANVISASADFATSVHAVDINHDGYVDVVSASANDDSIVWYDNDALDFNSHTVSTNADGARSVYLADLDGDGDVDILSASLNDNKVAWYENNGDSLPTFKERVITTNAVGARSVYAADMDGDGDLDVLSASRDDNKISLYINLAEPSHIQFSGETVISDQADGAQSVYLADLDRDGDVDVLSASSLNDTIAWYDNNGGINPLFITNRISTNALGVATVIAVDIDHDGRLDVLSSSGDDKTVAWYRNAGGTSIETSPRIITQNADGAFSLCAVDLDRDGDMDVLSGSLPGHMIVWYENNGAVTPSFTTNIISTNLDTAIKLHAVDLDHDGDLDVLSAFFSEDKIAWYENDGGIFVESIIATNANGAYALCTADMDKDGDLDVLAGSYNDNTLAWYENDGDVNPAFVSHVISTNAVSPNSIFAADLDRDGDADVLLSSEGSNSIRWYANNGAAVPLFTEYVISTNSEVVTSVYAKDLDRDGDLDVVAASYGGDKISWYENQKLSTFNQEVVTSTANGANAVMAVDLNRDGHLDVLSTHQLGDTVAWYENDGGSNPAFVEKIITTNVNNPRSLCFGDVDGDGFVDVVSGSQDDEKVAWYKNSGGSSPSFVTNIISTNINARSLQAVDMDKDGDLDLLVSVYSAPNFVGWLENDAGQFVSTNMVSANASGPVSSFAMDIDRDGDVDVVTAFYGVNAIMCYQNNGGVNPSFVEKVITTNVSQSESVFAVDMDGDGDVDVLAGTSGDHKVEWYENEGGTNLSFTSHTIDNFASGFYSVYAKDVDHDGDMDVLAADGSGNKVLLYKNNGAINPVFDARVIASVNDVNSVYVADVNGDGNEDLLAVSIGDDLVAWYKNAMIHRSAVFPVERPVSTNAAGAISVYAADLDQDGAADLISASADDNKIAWYRNNKTTNPSFEEFVLSTNIAEAISVYAVDMDGDGDQDILAAAYGGDQIVLFKNGGGSTPVFSATVISTQVSEPYSVYAADIDGDGDQDALSASFGDDKIAWYKNDGTTNPAFAMHIIASNALGAVSVHAADIDGDGDQDVLSASLTDDRIVWYRNEGGSDPVFTPTIIDAKAGAPFSLCAIDLDKDGDIDVIASSVSSNRITWYKNNGMSNPAFTTNVVSANVMAPYSVYISDLDLDGDQDVIAASLSNNTIIWCESDGAVSPSFSTHTISTNALDAVCVYAADLDQDGDQDVVSASGADDKIALYKNQGGQFAWTAMDTAPANIEQGDGDDMLKITVFHRGRSGDTDVKWATLCLMLEQGDGDPLTTTEANALIENISIYLDNGSGLFETNQDTLVTVVNTLNLSGGTQTVFLADTDLNTQTPYGASKTYYVVPRLTENARYVTPHQFRMTCLFQGESTAEDLYTHDGLLQEYTTNVLSSIATAHVTDTDGDGLPDFWELALYGGITNATASSDDDGDGFDNLEEYTADTIPTNDASYFYIMAVSNSASRNISYVSSEFRVYALQYTTNLMTNADWNNLQTNVYGTGGLQTLSDTNSTPAIKLYRLEAELP